VETPPPAVFCTGENEVRKLCTKCTDADSTKCADGFCIPGYGVFINDKICRECAHGSSKCDISPQVPDECALGWTSNDGNKCIECVGTVGVNACLSASPIVKCPSGKYFGFTGCIDCTVANADDCT